MLIYFMERGKGEKASTPLWERIYHHFYSMEGDILILVLLEVSITWPHLWPGLFLYKTLRKH